MSNESAQSTPSEAASLSAAPIVIIGSGLAAFTVAKEVRKLAPQQAVTLITREQGFFYAKPGLSNAFGAGKNPAQLIGSEQEKMASQFNLQILAHTDVTKIDAAQKTIETSQGSISYSQLVLALGADPIRLPIEGNAADQILSINDWQDYADFRQALEGKKRVAIMGAGLIGCEFANDLALAAYEVDVIDPSAQALGRLLPPVAGHKLQTALANVGVKWHFGKSVQSVNRLASGSLELGLSDGTQLSTDLLLSAVGLKPRTALAAASGITVNRGIVVNRHLQTNLPHIFALGDCAEVDGLVLPYVMPIMNAARALAPTLLGQPTAVNYPAMPVGVKTPALPVVVSPPAIGQTGQWIETETTDGVEALFKDEDGNLKGFALLGTATSQKAALTKLLPPLLA